MPKPTIHQIICEGTKNGLKYTIPKPINSDIGWQLMFGRVENFWDEEKRLKDNANKYDAKTYRDLEDFKRFV